MDCLDANQVIDFLDRVLATPPADVDRHLASCDDCRSLVAAMARGSGAAEGGDEAPAPGRIGRFVIEDVLGRGGMGVVFRAWDPELQRRVAVKRVRGASGDAVAREHARARLIREARALAQLAHPNVVAIHDVGVHDGDVYIAMEHVAGATLGQWLSTRPPPAAVHAALLAIGRGLAAAHSAGLVHRDVKPDNVIVGDDGRVRVVDFGLVAPAGAPVRIAAAELDAFAAGTGELTASGAAVGTPAFMSPEQRDGMGVDAASDQYSFAVTATVALTGERPDRTADPRQSLGRLPAEVRAALARALAPAPDARFPSMAALVAALDRAFRPRRRRWPFVALALAAAVGGAAVIARWGVAPAGPECDAAGELVGTWDPARAAAVAARFARSEHGAGAAIAARVIAALDRQAAAWVRQRRALCHDDAAGRGRAEERAARGRCLARGKQALATFGRVLTEGALDRARVDAALDAAIRMPSVDRCADGATLALADRGAPTDAAAVAREGRLAAIETLLALGDRDDAIAQATELAAQAASAGDQRNVARARYQEARALGYGGRLVEAEAALRDAIPRAARAGDDATVADGWVGLLIVLVERSRFDEARALVSVAEAAVARTGNDPRRTMSLLEALTSLAGWTHEYAPALDRFERDFAAAAAALGDDDPGVIQTLLNVAELMLEVDRTADAGALASRALVSAERVLGATHLSANDAHRVMGLVALAQDQPAQARVHFARVAAWADAIDDGHPYSYYAHFGLGSAWLDDGDRERAAAEFERARRAAVAGGGGTDYRASIALGRLSDLAWARGDGATAEAMIGEALAIRRVADGPAVETGRALAQLGALVASRGDREQARTHLEEALALHVADPTTDAASLALTQARLARVLWAIDRGRALTLVRAAVRYRSADPPPGFPPDVAPIVAWVREVCAAHGCVDGAATPTADPRPRP